MYLILALVVQVLVDATTLTGAAEWIARAFVPIAALLLPGGFLLSVAGRGVTEPNRLFVLIPVGACSSASAWPRWAWACWWRDRRCGAALVAGQSPDCWRRLRASRGTTSAGVSGDGPELLQAGARQARPQELGEVADEVVLRHRAALEPPGPHRRSHAHDGEGPGLGGARVGSARRSALPSETAIELAMSRRHAARGVGWPVHGRLDEEPVELGLVLDEGAEGRDGRAHHVAGLAGGRTGVG